MGGMGVFMVGKMQGNLERRVVALSNPTKVVGVARRLLVDQADLVWQAHSEKRWLGLNTGNAASVSRQLDLTPAATAVGGGVRVSIASVRSARKELQKSQAPPPLLLVQHPFLLSPSISTHARTACFSSHIL